METIRFDYNGTPKSFTRTPQGFLRVKANLSRTGIFKYNDKKEFRVDDGAQSQIVGIKVSLS